MLATAKEVAKIINEKYQAEVTEVRKGDFTTEGIVIGTEKTRPIFYVCNYIDGVSTNEDIANMIIEQYEDLDELDFNTELFSNWEHVRDNLMICVRPVTQNDEDLKFNYLDLELYVRYMLHEESYDGSIVIKKEHLKLWGVTDLDIYYEAIGNSRNKYTVNSIDNIILMRMSDIELENEPFDAAIEELSIGDEVPIMLVVSAINNLYGASAMVHRDIMKKLSEKFKGDFYILPSSIHEIICIPAYDVTSELSPMIREVNDSMLGEYERLSDHPYIYRRDKDEVEIA